MNRREFITKVAMVGGIAALQPWKIMQLLGTHSIEEAQHRLMDWDLSAEAVTPLNDHLVNAGTEIPLIGAGGIGDWALTQSSGTGAVSLNTNTSFKRPGYASSIKLDATSASADIRITRSNYTSFDATRDYLWGFWIYVPTSTDITNISSINLLVSTAGFTSYQTAGWNGSNLRVGWNWIPLPRLSGTVKFTQTGADPWANRTTIRFTLVTTVGGAATVYIADLWRGIYAKPWVAWCTDDIGDTIWQWARDEFVAFGITPLCFVTTVEINEGNSGQTSLANMQALESTYGWRFALHGQDHQNLLTLTQAQVEAQLITNIAALRANFSVPYTNILALPQPVSGATNSAVAAAAANLGITVIRSGVSSTAYSQRGFYQPGSSYDPNPNFLYDVPTQSLDGQTLAGVVNPAIDGTAGTIGPRLWSGVNSMHIHHIGTLADPEDPGTGGRTTRTNFRDILRYTSRLSASNIISQGGLHEWYDTLTSPRIKRI